MTVSRMDPFLFQPPCLPDVDSCDRIIRSATTFEVGGRVAAVAGESIEIEGMTAPLGAVCELHCSDGVMTRGRVIGFHGVRPVLAPLERLGALSAGDAVRLLDTTSRLRVGSALCGRVVDAFGQPLDGIPLPTNLITVDADRNPPASLDRPPIDTPLETGVQAIDAMLTCGQGQRLGIFAGSGVGKSTLLGMLARGSSADRIVIGLVGERGREVKEFLEHCLGEVGFARSVVVVATSDRPAAQRVNAAWTATAIAEAYRDEGHNVLLLLDSVSRFAFAQRELGLAAGEPPTTRGYPPSVFNLLPRLVERSGRTSRGSITAFYTVLVEGDDNNEPIADCLRGLLDGHLVLSRDLAEEAHWPPIDVLQSMSRLQPKMVSSETNQTVSLARQYLSEYRKHADLIAIGAYRAGSDPRVDTAIAMNKPLRDFLVQDSQTITKLQHSHAELTRLIRSPASLAASPDAAAGSMQLASNQMPATQMPATQTPATQTPATQTPATQTPATQTAANQTQNGTRS